MDLVEYLKKELEIDISKAREIVYVLEKYKKEKPKRKLKIKIPTYSLGEELLILYLME